MYDNAEMEKSKIYTDNKNRVGIYLWLHKLSGKLYVGSSFNLSRRFSQYYSKANLVRYKSMHICNALSLYGHSEFSLYILKYIDVNNLSEKEALELLLSHEQYYIDLINPEYNILKLAGSSLGFKHSPESLIKLSEAMKGKIHSAETKMKISLAMIGKNNPMFGKSHSEEIRALISLMMKGKNLGKLHSSETKLKMSLAKKGLVKSAEHKEKISKSCKGLNLKKVYVYSIDSVSNEKILSKCFNSCNDAAKEYNVKSYTISKYLDKNKLFQNKWFLYRNPIDSK
jgi:group I intron endonuclease